LNASIKTSPYKTESPPKNYKSSTEPKIFLSIYFRLFRNRNGTQPNSFPDAAATLAHALSQIVGWLAGITWGRGHAPSAISRPQHNQLHLLPDEQPPASRTTAQRGRGILQIGHPQIRIRHHPASAVGAAGEDQDQGQCHPGPHGHSAAAIPPAESSTRSERQQRTGERPPDPGSQSHKSPHLRVFRIVFALVKNNIKWGTIIPYF